jgi:hypothetical protein
MDDGVLLDDKNSAVWRGKNPKKLATANPQFFAFTGA